ncbi:MULTISPECIES: serine/threonine-protein kinase [unclassified Streptomyces]|uniref:serine/threonine-protein kinase n=1 Tax=unclassified Streptomyces TaxID=2593676 RepID=UPI0019670474|nr:MULTISPECIES: serine/threonine-protein kinase [unclassified Streptomyces]
MPVYFLGSGAFGDTWKAGTEAVKIICTDDYPRTRLEREVEGLSRVDSPYVVAFRGLQELQLGGVKRPALHFEYIAGGDVERRLNEGDLVPKESVVGFLAGLLLGVQALHKAATIHRDIKPANIALRDGQWDRPVLLDLGLAKQMDASTITVYPGHIGTMPYMAPEQLEGRRARKAADLWAVGVSVRQMITGRHPFYLPNEKYTISEAHARLTGGPESLPADCPDVVKQVLDRITSVVEHERGSSASNLMRLTAH